MEPWGSIIVGGLGLTGVITSSALLFLRGRGDSKQKLNEYIDQRVEAQLKGALTELDSAKTKLGAAARVLLAISRQTPTGFYPRLNPEDVAILEDTLPPQWVGDPGSVSPD